MKGILLSLFSIVFSISYGQLTYVPDDAFEAYLETWTGVDNGVANDDYVLTAGMSGIMTMTNVPNNIADFTGIEECENLAVFKMINNNVVSSLDLSSSHGNFFAATYFDLYINGCYNLQTLITPDTLLKFDVQDNFSLTAISFSPNTVLTYLTLQSNYSLESFDISNTEVQDLPAWPCHLSIQSNSNLKCLALDNGFCPVWASVLINFNPLLNCIQVDNPSYSQASWFWSEYQQDPTNNSYSTNCNNDCSVGIDELSNTPKQLLKIVDYMGRETAYKPNTPLIYIYSDGTTERVFEIE